MSPRSLGEEVRRGASVSVVIPCYQMQETLPQVLDALEPQVVPAGHQVVIVQSGPAPAVRPVRESGWAELIRAESRLFPGEARNLGAAHAAGQVLAFVDADAVPQPGWLSALLQRLEDGIDAVSGAVENGTPESRWGTAEYLLEFLEWVPERRGRLEHGVGCNLLVRRPAFERAGGFPTGMRAGEDTVLTAGLAARGLLVFTPAARVRHLNRTSPRNVLANQRRLGRAWVDVCAQVPLPGSEWVTPGRMPLAVAGRLLALVRHARRYGTTPGPIGRHLPYVLAGLLAWGSGVWAGARSAGRMRAPR